MRRTSVLTLVLALVAIARKLLVTANALVKNNARYTPQSLDS